MHSSERACSVALLRSKSFNEDFKWPAILNRDKRKQMWDRSRSLALSESGALMYQGKKVPSFAECLDALGDLHPPELTTGHSCNLRSHATIPE